MRRNLLLDAWPTKFTASLVCCLIPTTFNHHLQWLRTLLLGHNNNTIRHIDPPLLSEEWLLKFPPLNTEQAVAFARATHFGNTHRISEQQLYDNIPYHRRQLNNNLRYSALNLIFHISLLIISHIILSHLHLLLLSPIHSLTATLL